MSYELLFPETNMLMAIREPGEDPEGPQVEDPDLSEVSLKEIEEIFKPSA